MAMTTLELMLMVNKEAQQNRTKTASPAAIPYSRGKIAKQAAPVNGQDERRINAPPLTSAA